MNLATASGSSRFKTSILYRNPRLLQYSFLLPTSLATYNSLQYPSLPYRSLPTVSFPLPYPFRTPTVPPAYSSSLPPAYSSSLPLAYRILPTTVPLPYLQHTPPPWCRWTCPGRPSHPSGRPMRGSVWSPLFINNSFFTIDKYYCSIYITSMINGEWKTNYATCNFI